MSHKLPDLNYDYDALEPYVDAQTMEIHHSKHHQGYVNKLNKALEKYPDLQEKNINDLLKEINNLDIPVEDKTAIINNGGGHANHSLFWQVMDPGNKPDENLKSEIEKEFGSIDDFKKVFSDAASSQFGSGWAWLVKKSDGKLTVYSTANQDSPLLKGDQPIIALDVWEHAYYLKYQNKRPEYIENWWQVVKTI